MAEENFSAVHFRAVRAEITGRFFSPEEAAALKAQIDRHTIGDPHTRAAAAEVWADQIEQK